jgi:hypothetical protein
MLTVDGEIITFQYSNIAASSSPPFIRTINVTKSTRPAIYMGESSMHCSLVAENITGLFVIFPMKLMI